MPKDFSDKRKPLHGSGGKAASPPIEAANTLQSNHILRLIDVLCEGPIDSIEQVYLNETPLTDDQGNPNFDGVEVAKVLGTPDQSYVPGFTSQESETIVDTPVVKDTPVIRTITNADTDACRVVVKLPALFEYTDEGDMLGADVTYQVQYRPSGGSWIDIPESPVRWVDEKNTSPVYLAHRFSLTGSAPWDIRVVRVTEDSEDNSKLQNGTAFFSYAEIVEQKLTYRNTAYLGIVANAQQFGDNIPSRAALVNGLICEVPTNFDPETRTYSGIWNGTWKLAWTDCPAWCLRNLILSKRFGLGQYIKPQYLDPITLYTISQYSAEQVPDGKGGTEPRFSFNAIIQTRQEAYDLINAMASAFRGMVYWSLGTSVFTQDSPADPVVVATRANTVNGEFNYSGSAITSVHNRVNVTWNNPDNFYKRDIVSVEDAEHIAQHGLRPTDIVAFGCTSKSQAIRAGRWLLYTERMESEVVNYVAGQDHCDVVPGSIVRIMDPVKHQAELAGRVVSSSFVPPNGAQLTLDREVTLEVGETYELMIHDKDRQVHYRTVNSAPGAHTTISLSAALPPLTENPRDTVWSLRKVSATDQLFRVITNREVGEHQYEITALAYASGKYDIIENNLDIPDAPLPLLPSGSLPSPVFTVREEQSARVGASNRTGLVLNITRTTDPRVRGVEVQYQRKGQAWITADLKDSNSLEVPDVVEGARYVFRARSYSVNGLYSSYSNNLSVNVTGLPLATASVSPPISPQLLPGFQTINVAWINPTDPNFMEVEVWASSTNDVNTATRRISTPAESHSFTGLGNEETLYVWLRSRVYSTNALYSDFVYAGTATTLMVNMGNLAPDVTGAIDDAAASASADVAAAQAAAAAAALSVTAAETAQDAAETAQAAAEVAEANSSSAASLSEAARDLAQSYAASASLSEGVVVTAQEAISYDIAATGPQFLRTPAESWTADGASSHTSITKPAIPETDLITGDADFDECYEFPSKSNLTVGQAYPFGWSGDDVLEVRVAFKVVDDGTNTPQAGGAPGCQYRIGVTTQDGTTLNGVNIQTAGAVARVADGVVVHTAWFSARDLANLPSSLPAGVELVRNASLYGALIYPHFRQNWSGTPTTNAKTRVGSITVRNVTALADAMLAEEEAAGSAIAAGQSEFNAAAYESDAASYAAAALDERVLAETARAGAETAESNAASSETTAAGSAASAASSASVTAEITAQALPSDFERDDFFFRGTSSGAPDPGVTGLGGSLEFGDDAQEGRVLKVVNPTGTYEYLRTQGVVPALVGRTYRVTIRARYTGSIVTSDTYHLSVPIAKLDGTYASIGTQWLSQITLTTTWTDHVQEWTTSGTMPAFWRPGITVKDAVTGTGTIEISRFIFEDITESAEASVQAAAAANSAALAQASEDDAGTYASAAQTAQSLAETAEANARASEVSAASSETNAAGSAASASAAQSVAVSAADTVTDYIPALHPMVPREPREAWTYSSQSVSTALRKPAVNALWLVTDDAEFGYAARPTLAGNTTVGHADPLPWDQNRVYEVEVHFRVFDDGTNPAGIRTAVGASVFNNDLSGVITNQQTADKYTLAAAGLVVQKVWFSYRDLAGIGSPDYRYKVNALTGDHVYFHIRQNAAGSSDGQISVGKFIVRDITTYVDTLVSEDAAAVSASASADSASTASIKADEAGNSADAAEVSRLAAVGAQGAAEAARDLAVSYRDDADGYASSALASQNLAVSAADEALSQATMLFPEKTNADGNFFTGINSGLAPTQFSSSSVSLVSGEGYVINRQGFLFCNPAGYIPAIPGKTYEVEAKIRAVADNTVVGGDEGFGIDLTRLDDTGSIIGYGSLVGNKSIEPLRVSDGWVILSGVVTIPSSPGYTYIRPRLYGCYQAGGPYGNTQWQVSYISVKDVTESESAAASASAANQSASTASASSDTAGDYADAADVSRIDAQGAQGAAEAARDLAVAYRDDAEGAAASALASSVLAASLSREAQSYASGNLIVDGIFANDWDDYWNGDSNTTIAAYDHSSTVPDADMSLQVTGTGYARYRLTGELPTAIKGRTLRFSGTRRVAGTSYKIGIRWATIDTNSYLRMQTVTLSATADVWETFERDFTLTNNPNEKATNVIFQAVQGASDVSYLTDFRVEDITETTELSGRITSIETIDLSELAGTAMATFFSEMEVNASGNSAKVTEWSQTTADLDGFASAHAGLAVSTSGGAIAGFYATSFANPDGSGGGTLELLGDVIAQGSITTNKLSVGLQNNMIQDSRFANGLANWNSWGSGGAGSNSSLALRPAGATWAGLIDPTLSVYQPGTETDGNRRVQYRPAIDSAGTIAIGAPITEGSRYSWSARVSAHRCSCQIYLLYYDENGSWVGETAGNTNAANAGSSSDPHSWPLLHVISTAPAGAKYARPEVRKYGTSSGTNSWMFIAEPMLAETHPDATEPTIYSPPDSTFVDGGRMFTGSIDADKITVANLSALGLVVTNADIVDDISSSNYSAGVSGWIINQDGSAEFNGPVISRQLEIASGSFSWNGSLAPGASQTFRFVNTGIRIGADDVWNTSKVTLLATARAVPASASGAGNGSLWGVKAEAYNAFKWLGSNVWDGTLGLQYTWSQDPATLVTPAWSSGINERVLLDIELFTSQITMNNPITIHWKVYQVT